MKRTDVMVSVLMLVVVISFSILVYGVVSRINAGVKAELCILVIDPATRTPADAQHCLDENGL